MAEAQESEAAVSVVDLTVNFGKVQALSNINLEIKKGEIFGIVGTNGAGKSTLIDVLSGMVKPSSGRIRVLGLDPIRQAARLRRIIGVIPQETSVEERLSAEENLRYFGRLLDVPSGTLGEQVDRLIRFMGLLERKDDPVETYSVGMKKKVHFACSIVHSPQLIMVDEVTAGFDPRTKRDVEKLILKMNREQGLTCLLTTHDLLDASRLCDRLAVLHRGRVVSQGTWGAISSACRARLIVRGIPKVDEGRLTALVSPRKILPTLGGVQIEVDSRSEAFSLVGLLEAKGIQASSISFEVPPDEVFDVLTEDEGA